MSDFMSNGSSVLPGVKSDARAASIPVGASEWAGADANQIRQALLDLRGNALNAQTGFVNPNVALVTATGSSTARTMAARAADVVNVKDFGAKGDGTTDDTAAIQAAINSANRGSRIYFPGAKGNQITDGRYYRTTSTITISADDITLSGEVSDNSGYATSIKNTVSGPVFTVTGHRFSMWHLDLHGNFAETYPSLPTVSGILLTGGADGNLDSTIRFCTFDNFLQAVEVAGRNFHFTDNIIGQCIGAVKINAAASGETRNFFIERNHLEGIGDQTLGGLAKIIDVPGVAFNVQVKHNFGYTNRYAKFVVAGTGVSRLVVSGNTLDVFNNSFIELDTATDVEIDGNSVRWGTPWSTYSPYAPAAYGIVFTSITRGSISGNKFTGCPRQAIFSGSPSVGVSVVGNVFHNCSAVSANANDAIYFVGAATDLLILGNIVSADAATYHRYGINAGNGAGSRTVIGANQVGRSGTADYNGVGDPSYFRGDVRVQGILRSSGDGLVDGAFTVGTGSSLNGGATVASDTGGNVLKLKGRTDHLGYITFFKNDGTTQEGAIYGATGKMVLADAAGTDVLTIAGGVTAVGGASGPTLKSGTGVPSYSAPKGSLYLRTDGGAATCFYVNESGSTTWTAK